MDIVERLALVGTLCTRSLSQQDSVGFVHLPVAEVGTRSTVCPLHRAHLSPCRGIQSLQLIPALAVLVGEVLVAGGGPLNAHHQMSPPLLPRHPQGFPCEDLSLSIPHQHPVGLQVMLLYLFLKYHSNIHLMGRC